MRTILWLGLVAACSSGASTPSRPTKPTPATPDAAVAAAATAPTVQECEQLVAHVVDLALREHTPAVDPPPSEAEAKQVEQPLRSFVTECGTLSREAYRCGMDAASLAALASCQATRSSSTSNSSVAPPGITPPAPRSP